MGKKNLIYLALAVGFFIFGISVIQDAMPSKKSDRIYSLIKPELPYLVEKRFGGLQIRIKKTDEVFKPSNKEFFDKIESMDKFWAKDHLKLISNGVVIVDDNNKTIKKIIFQNENEKDFTINYFDLEQK